VWIVATCRLPDSDSRIFIGGRFVLMRVHSGTQPEQFSADDDDAPTGQQALRLVDVVTGENLWSISLSARARVLQVQDDEIGIVEPTGRFIVMGLTDGRTRVDAAIDPLPNLEGGIIIRSRERYVLFTTSLPQRQANEVASVGPYVTLVHGPAYGFDRATGQRQWRTIVDQQFVGFDQPADLPVIVLTARSQRNSRKSAEFGGSQPLVLELLDARTGRFIYRRGGPEVLSPYTASASRAWETMTISFPKFTVELTIGDVPTSEELKPVFEIADGLKPGVSKAPVRLKPNAEEQRPFDAEPDEAPVP